MCMSLIVPISGWCLTPQQSSWLSTERGGGKTGSESMYCTAVVTVTAAPKTLQSQKMVHQELLDVVSLSTTAHAYSEEGAFLIWRCCRRGPGPSLAVGSFPWQGVTFVHHGAEESCAASSESGWFLHGQMTVLLLTPLLTSLALHPWAVLRKATSVLV